MSRTWQENAAEFGALTKQGYGVRLAVLVACSVEKGTRGGDRAKPGLALPGKVNMDAFAAQAGVARSTIQSYVEKWDRMVAAGWQVDRAGLSPDDVNTLDLGGQFTDEFEALATAGSSGLTGKAADIAKNPRAMRAAIIADPGARAAMAEAIKADPEVARVAHDAAFESMVTQAGGTTTPMSKVPDPRPDWKVRWLAFANALNLLLAEIVRLERAGEDDQATKAREHLHTTLSEYGVRIYGGAPDDVSEITS